MATLYQEFLQNFTPQVKVQSPGRINLIGEHTDYNGGFVLPTAIDKFIIFSLRKNDTQSTCNVMSVKMDVMLTFDLEDIKPSKNNWENYVLGVVRELLILGKELSGFDCLIESDLPIGSGISSSAALECGLAYGLNKLYGLDLGQLDIVALGQRAEHNYVGSKCGIMDQYASVMSKEGHVILLDCKNIHHRYIKAKFDPYEILLLNTNVSHNLADSAYNDRRESCEAVTKLLKKQDPEITCLRDAKLDVLNSCKSELSAEYYKRARYVLAENDRVLTAAGILETGDIMRFGELMYASHQGLQYEYDVSCPELDFLVAFSKKYDSVIGSRMMGGGFGGCTINLVHKDHVQAYIADVAPAYKNKFGRALSAFSAKSSEGTKILTHE